jgi:hypothetical protein
MKNTLLKVWGIVLTLAILSGLLMATVPVSADKLSWSDLNKPAVTVTTNANVFTIAADGNTMYLYDNNTNPVLSKLYKSTDGGITWSTAGLDADGTLRGAASGSAATHVITQIKVSKFNANYLIATDANPAVAGKYGSVYDSYDGGQSWGVEAGFGGYTSTSQIYGVDISATSSGTALLVGYANNVALAINNRWYDTSSATYTSNPTRTLGYPSWLALGTPSAIAVAFSPNFNNDSSFVVIADTGTYVTALTYVYATGASWGGDVATTGIPSDTYSASYGPVASLGGGTPLKGICDIAIPSDFNWTSASYSKVFFSMTSISGSAANATVLYRVNFRGPNTATTRSYIYNVGAPCNVSSLDFKGTTAAGTLAVGAYDDNTIYTAAAVSTITTAITFNNSTNNPRYTTAARPNTLVTFSTTSNKLYAGTAGAPGSALSISSDYNSFVGISFISVSSLANVNMSAGKGGLSSATATIKWQKLYDAGYLDWMLFKSSDNGATWQFVYENGNVGFTLWQSPAFATDNTVYLQQSAPKSNKIIKSVDGFATWGSVTSLGNVNITAFAPIDGTNYWYGCSTGVGNTITGTVVALSGGNPMIISAFSPVLFVWEDTGSGWQIWVSTDNGVTYKSTDAINQLNNGTNSAFAYVKDTAGWQVWVVDSGKNVKYWTAGVSTVWTTGIAASDMATTANMYSSAHLSDYPITAITRSAGGVWYFRTPTNPAGEIWRSVDLKTFEPIQSTIGVGTLSSFALANNTDGSATVYMAMTGIATTTAYANKYSMFTDTMVTAPATSTPANGDKASNTINGMTTLDIVFKTVPSATGYQVQIAYDQAFTEVAKDSGMLTGNIWAGVQVSAGRDYYYRVRVYQGYPYTSPWSTPVKFTATAPSSTSQGLDELGRIYPTQGSVITGTALTLTWGSVASASSYDVQVLKNGTQVLSKTALTDTFLGITVDPNASYVWMVRATSNGVAGSWVSSAFTTIVPPATNSAPTTVSAPVVTPIITYVAPAVTVPQATVIVNPTVSSTSNGTPAWAWIVIVIGAVLVIAVIVLIVRTRKV